MTFDFPSYLLGVFATNIAWVAVLATACGIMEEQGWIMNDRVREELKCGAKPYQLKKGGE